MIKDDITQRYADLARQMQVLPINRSFDEVPINEVTFWKRWAASALNLVRISFGRESNFVPDMERAISSENVHGIPYAAAATAGIFAGAQDDYNRGFATTLDQRISGEIFGDFLNSASVALQEGHKDSAAVLAAVAFEDSLKKIGMLKGLNVAGKELHDLVNLMAANQILAGASVKIASSFVKTRNAAMHAEWSKITDADVSALIGFPQPIIAQYLS
jgi:hypothetical protein